MKYFLFCVIAVPPLIIGLLMIVVVVLMSALAFITWDLSPITELIPVTFGALTWTEIRLMWIIGLFLAFAVWVKTND